MVRSPASASQAGVPALRFLLLCLGSWTLLRGLMLWDPGHSLAPAAARPPWSVPSPYAIATMPAPVPAPPATDEERLPPAPPGPARAVVDIAVRARSDGEARAGRPSFHPDLGAFLVQPAGLYGSAGLYEDALPAPRGAWPTPPIAAQPAAAAPAGIDGSLGMRQRMTGWSVGSWLYLREGSGRAPGGIADGGQLGGSQAGMRLSHGFGATGRVRAYGRATVALHRLRQRELAAGVAYAPLAPLPVDIAVERRFAVGREGRSAFAVMAAGGVGDVILPAGFRLDVYAQAGLVGTGARDGFADGAVVVDHGLGKDDGAGLRIGVLAAAAVQPGAARVDVGPRLTLRLPHLGEGARVALDWRQRIAGDARPESGLALTLAADF